MLITAAVGNPYILIPAFLIVVGFIALRWYYLKTSRDIKRLEAIGEAWRGIHNSGASSRALEQGLTELANTESLKLRTKFFLPQRIFRV